VSDSSGLITGRFAEDGTLTIPISACESADIDPPTRVFLNIREGQIRITAEVAGVAANRHEPEVAVQQAREVRRDPGGPPALEETFEGIAANSRKTPEEVLFTTTTPNPSPAIICLSTTRCHHRHTNDCCQKETQNLRHPQITS
jgi:hypothetical protein